MRDSYKTLLGMTASMLATLCLVYVLLPVAGVFLGISNTESLDWLALIKSPRIRDLLLTSIWIAVSAGLVATFFGGLFASTLRQVEQRAQFICIGGILGLHLISPYLITQSAIRLLGDAGSIWSLLGIKPVFSLFTAVGVVGILSIWLMPLAMLVQLMRKCLPATYREELAALNASRLQRLRLYWWPSHGRSILLSIGICGLLAFWNYDVASMLRVNVFPVELMAAFGSFYDYEMAVGLAGIPVLGSLLIIMCLFWLCVRQQWVSQLTDRRDSEVSSCGRRSITLFVGLLVLTVYSVLIGGLWVQIGGVDAFWIFLSDYQEELWNTVSYGLVSAVIVTVLTVALIVSGRLITSSKWQFPVVATLACWLLPPVLLAMGWVSLWNFPVLHSAREEGIEMYLIGVHSVIVLIPVLGLLASSTWSPVHNEALDTTNSPCHLRCLLLLNRLKGLLFVLAFAGFALVAREVAAGLLNMPPGGSNLAISIETLLHFEQPDRVAALCLAYLLVILGVAVVLGMIGYSLDSAARSILARRLKV